MSTIRDDDKDFYDPWGPRLCRGNRLADAVKEVEGGVPSKDHLVGGFSSSGKSCKRFAGSRITGGEKAVIGRLPAVTIFSEQEFHEKNPKAVKVVYEKEWLEKHPKFVKAIQTFDWDDRPFESQVESAIHFENEMETIVEDKTAKIPLPAKVNVYVGPEEIKEAELVQWSYWNELKDYVGKMDEMVALIKKFLPEEFPADVQVFFCHETLNLSDEDRCACKYWDTIYAKE